jgi:hypothetical protein
VRFPRDGQLFAVNRDEESVVCRGTRNKGDVDLVTGPVHDMGHIRKGVLRNVIDARDQTVLRFSQSDTTENCV